MKISIIIPIYNVEPFLEKCLNSVANQTFTKGIECLLVDDCGTDNSMEIAERFISEHKGEIVFRVLYHNRNKGLSAARNTGILAAKGEYVYFLDSDDIITSNCMAGFMRIIKEHPGVDLIQGLIDQNSAYMNQFSNKTLPSYTEDRIYIKRALLDYDELPVCAANKMIRRQLIIDNNLYFKEGIIHEDNYWSFYLAKHVRSLAVYPKKCYLYTVNPSSITKAINVEKEKTAFQTMITDFCRDIDPYLSGKQKAAILRLLNTFINNHYYETKEELDRLFHVFCQQCTTLEKTALKIWYKSKLKNEPHTKLFKICTRLFRLSDLHLFTSI